MLRFVERIVIKGEVGLMWLNVGDVCVRFFKYCIDEGLLQRFQDNGGGFIPIRSIHEALSTLFQTC